MSAPPTLFELLPAVHRVRDAAQGNPLQRLLEALQGEVELLREDVQQLYDDWFIETCDDWVVPYIGDLLGVRGLLDIKGTRFSQRGLVANTIAYRRRKGTAAVLEQLAADVTGWPAKAVEFFQLLGWTQNVNHVRDGAGGTANLHDENALELVDGPFDRTAHTADVRHVDIARGRHNIPNVGIFLWRLGSYSLERSTARPDAAQPGRYTFGPLGLDTPLFNPSRTERAIEHLAEEVNVPGPLRRRALFAELAADPPGDEGVVERFLSPVEPAFSVFLGAAPVDPADLAICDLTDPSRRAPSGKKVAVDPKLGRIALAKNANLPSEVRVSWSYGFPGDLGGGPYDRRESLAAAVPNPEAVDFQLGVVESPTGPDLTGTFTGTGGALPTWAGLATPPALGLIAVMDSRTYEEDLKITIPAGCTLVIAAATWDEQTDPLTGVKRRVRGRAVARDCRPYVKSVQVTGGAPTATAAPGTLVLDGLLIGGDVKVASGRLGHLRVAHCTIAPGLGGLTVASGNTGLTVDVERCICGPISVHETAHLVSVRDSIVDGHGAPALTGPDAAIESSTLLGTTGVRTLQASNTIFAGDLDVERRQSGCVRYSYLPLASRAPRRYRCQPGSASEGERIVPAFTSLTYGDAGYGQLAPDCPPEVSRGAEDEGEMGAFNFVQAAHRTANLSARLDEFMRVGLEAGTFFVT